MNAPRDPRPEAVRLAGGLRELKDRTRLSLAGLAAETRYSKSSWERYLNGKALPPRPAVRSLCRLAGEPDERLLALLDLANRFATPDPAPAGPAAGAPAGGPAPAPAVAAAPPAPRRRPARLLAAVLAVLLGGPAAAALAFALWPAPSAPAQPAARCRGASCDGRSPASTFCGLRPTTLATRHAAGGELIDIRYSTRCLATWARISRSRVGDRIDIGVPGGRSHEARVTDRFDATGYVYTAMTPLDARRGVRVCLEPATGSRQCFTAHATP